MNADNTTELERWVVTGLAQGAKQSLCSGIAWLGTLGGFTLLIGLFQLINDLSVLAHSSPQIHFDTAAGLIGNFIIEAIFLFIFVTIYGLLIGVTPALLLGMISGGIIAAVLHLPHIAPYRWNRVSAGVGIGLLIVIVINNKMGYESISVLDVSYWLLVGAPSLIFLGICAWQSDQLPALVKARYTVKEIPAHVSTPALHQEGN